MADLNQTAENNSVNLQDWRVWAEINYLDSPTEYREYLPNQPGLTASTRSDFILLSEFKLPSSGRSYIYPLIIFLVVALISAYCVYALLQSF